MRILTLSDLHLEFHAPQPAFVCGDCGERFGLRKMREGGSSVTCHMGPCGVCGKTAAVREFMHAECMEIHVLGIEDIYEPFAEALVAALVASLEGPLPDVAAIISQRIDPILAAAKRKT